MNGECVEYASLKKPMNWEDFKKLPDDLKKDYITAIREKFGAPDKHIAEMLGVASKTLGLYLCDLKISAGRGGSNSKWEKEKFYAWFRGVEKGDVDESVNEAPEGVRESNGGDDGYYDRERIPAPNSTIPTNGCLNFSGSADAALEVVRALLGNAKVNLHIQWDTADL